MSRLEPILAMLEKVKGRGGNYVACCPAHADRSPSLTLRETNDGTVLLHCFAGCSVQEICDALGIAMTDLFPPKADDHRHPDYTTPAKPQRVRFMATDLLKVIAFEAQVVMVAANDMSFNRPLSDGDRERLRTAVTRISEALDAGGAA